jgi:hypothetical protein
MLASLLFKPAGEQMPVAELADRLETQQHQSPALLLLGNLGEPLLEELDADSVARSVAPAPTRRPACRTLAL